MTDDPENMPHGSGVEATWGEANRERSQRIVLTETLRALVPLWIAEVATWGPGQRRWRAQHCARIVGTFGASVQYHGAKAHRTRHLEGGSTLVGNPGPAGVFSALAEGLALAAYQPGGVTAFGTHWQA